MSEFTLPANSKVGEGKRWPLPEQAKRVKSFRIYRWDPAKKATPTLDTFEIDLDHCDEVHHAESDDADERGLPQNGFDRAEAEELRMRNADGEDHRQENENESAILEPAPAKARDVTANQWPSQVGRIRSAHSRRALTRLPERSAAAVLPCRHSYPHFCREADTNCPSQQIESADGRY